MCGILLTAKRQFELKGVTEDRCHIIRFGRYRILYCTVNHKKTTWPDFKVIVFTFLCEAYK